MTPRTLFVLLLAAGLPSGCAPDSTRPLQESLSGDTRAIHITRDGIPVDSIIRSGTFGIMKFGLAVEARDGTLRPLGDVRPVWGSTQPSIVNPAVTTKGEMTVFRHQNGRARIIAEVGRFRDSVILETQQVATAIEFDADTLVTLTPGARDISGAPTAYHTFRFGAQRVDSSGFPVPSAARIDYTAAGDAPFDLFSGVRGDTLSIAGRVVGTGSVIVRVSGISDTIPVQVADAYLVLRLTAGTDRLPRPLPPSVTIPRGTAIIFRNETALPEVLGEPFAWRVGPIAPGATQAQLFATPGAFSVQWARQFCVIIVTP